MAVVNTAVELSPIWYTLRNQLAYTIGKTPNVEVLELIEGEEGMYHLPIRVTSCLTQAEAVRLVVKEEYIFGNIKVITEVSFNDTLITMPDLAITTPEKVIEILKNAFWCNPLYKGAINVTGQLPPVEQDTVGSVVGVICPVVIQFFNDDISNLCNDYVEVASVVFQEVMNLTYGEFKISFSTYNETCMKNSKIEKACCL